MIWTSGSLRLPAFRVPLGRFSCWPACCYQLARGRLHWVLQCSPGVVMDHHLTAIGENLHSALSGCPFHYSYFCSALPASHARTACGFE